MILGIDYGRSHIGIATSEGNIAKPEETLLRKGGNREVEDIRRMASSWGVERIIVGLSEGKMAKETKLWGEYLGKMLQLPVEFVDETLTSVEAGEDRDKVKQHSKAAAVILQRYLNDKNQETR